MGGGDKLIIPMTQDIEQVRGINLSPTFLYSFNSHNFIRNILVFIYCQLYLMGMHLV